MFSIKTENLFSHNFNYENSINLSQSQGLEVNYSNQNTKRTLKIFNATLDTSSCWGTGNIMFFVSVPRWR